MSESVWSESALRESFRKFCELRKEALDKGVLDLTEMRWIYPTLLLPLGEFIRTKKDAVKIIMPADAGVRSYITTMISETSRILPTKTYIPIVKLPPVQDAVETSLKKLYEKFREGETVGGRNAFMYVIHELIGNIYEHSSFTTAFVMAQVYQKKKYMELCFFDNGKTIPGNFKEHNVLFEEDANAIISALKGRSTKSQERGKGLGTSMKILTKGLKGEALIVSASGMVSLSEAGIRGYILPDTYTLQGTLISAKIPFPVTKKVNIYEDYVE